MTIADYDGGIEKCHEIRLTPKKCIPIMQLEVLAYNTISKERAQNVSAPCSLFEKEKPFLLLLLQLGVHDGDNGDNNTFQAEQWNMWFTPNKT